MSLFVLLEEKVWTNELREIDVQGARMAAMISYLLEKENPNLQGAANRISDKVLGKPRKVYILTGTGSYFDPHPGTAWWFMANEPVSEKELLFKEAGKFALGWVAGLASPFAGLDLASAGKDTAEALTGSTGIMNEAVDTAVWQLVKKTDNAWVIAIKNYLCGGCVAFEKTNYDYQVWLRTYSTSKTGGVDAMMRWLSTVESKYGNDDAGGVAKTREYAKNSSNKFSMSQYGETKRL